MDSRTAAQNKIPLLYHWQKFDLARLEQQLREGTVFCSKPIDFNDPWDCRPFFNTDLLAHPNERQKHIDWAVEICKRDGRIVLFVRRFGSDAQASVSGSLALTRRLHLPRPLGPGSWQPKI